MNRFTPFVSALVWVVVAVVVVVAAASAEESAPSKAAAQDNWPQFRGPTGQGVSEAAGLPLTWGEAENVKWKTPVHGKAWSSPVVWGDQVWMSTATEDAKELSAVCVDRETGKVVHDLKLFTVDQPQFVHPFNSPASPTPVIEAGRVYVTFGSPGTACIDTNTGKVLWTRTDFVANHFRGAGSSPLVYKDLLILPFDGSDHQFIAAMDKNTGETRWKTGRSIDFQDIDPKTGMPEAEGDWRKAFSTPRLVTAGGGTELVSLGSKALYAYDPETGKELWRVEHRQSHSGSATPVIGPDGTIYYCTGLGSNELWAVKPGGSGVVSDTHVLWRVRRGVPGRTSVLLVDDLIYMVTDQGVATCVQAKDGAEVWSERLEGNYSASPIYADGRVYFFSEEGDATVIAAGRDYKVLAENQSPDGFMATPAVAGKALFLRTRTHLYRVEDGGKR